MKKSSIVFHKCIALLLAATILFFLVSCGNNAANEETENIEIVNMQELNETAVVEAMNFDSYSVSVIYNTNEEVPINRTVDIYGVILGANDTATVKEALTDRFCEVRLYEKNECIVTSNQYNVETIAVENGILFTLHLVADSIPTVTATYNIDEIRFVYASGLETKRDIASYWLTVYREEKNKINVIEAPAANAIKIHKDEFLVVNYLFLSANVEARNNFNVSFNLPSECAVDVSLMEIVKDEEMTEIVLSEMYFDLAIEQRERLTVYKMPVSFTKKTDNGFIIQLLFSTDIIGGQQYMGAFCPLIVQ